MTNSPIGKLPAGVRVAAWLVEPPADDVKRALQRIARAPDVRALAIMPDVHLAEHVCIGTVIATERLVYPQAVGGDIGCGMAAIRFDVPADVLAASERAHALLAALREAIPALRHRSIHAAPPWPDVLPLSELSDGRLASALRREAAIELGTLGRGNHFLEFQAGEDGALWLMVHSGSRCVGPAIANWHLEHASAAGGGLRSLDASTDQGAAYVNDCTWAARFADLNRRQMIARAADVARRILGATPLEDSRVSCDHNHLRRETVDGRACWVHRKGANAAADGQPGIIAGSMGTMTVITSGRGWPAALQSSSHGAGRALSRSDARRSVSPDALRRQLEGVHVDESAIPRLVEEAPGAYKDIRAVLRAQRDLVRIVVRLHPPAQFQRGVERATARRRRAASDPR